MTALTFARVAKPGRAATSRFRAPTTYAGLAAACILAPSAGAADPVQPAQSSVYVYVNGTLIADGGDYAGAGATYGSTTGAPGPSATASTSAADESAGVTYTTLIYYFEVNGPGSEVPIDLSGLASVSGAVASGEGEYEATTEGEIYGTNTNEIFGRTDVLGCGSGVRACESFTPTPPGAYTVGGVSVSIGQIYGISLSVTASVFNAASVVATLDPTITIDPSVHDPSAYQLLLSPGIDNPVASGVPEPATWAMMLVGVGAMGTALRRLRRNGAMAAA